MGVALSLSLLAGCSSGSSSTAKPGGTDAGTTTTVAQPELREYAVGSRTETFVDTTRPTVGNPDRDIPAADSRTLPVTILYPATGDAAPANEPVPHPADATPAEGTFPLVIFSHGVTASGAVYVPLLAAWAREGFIVVAPTFPMTSGGGAWANLSDYVNQPADVKFLIDSVLKLDTTDGDALQGHLNPDEVAIAGHSLGAITSLGFYNTCCRDPRVKAVVALSGVMLPFGDGSWKDPPSIPLLMVHGGADKTVPYAGGSATTFTNLSVPRALVSIPTAGHTDIFGGKDNAANGESTQDAVLAFLQLELRHDDRAWKKLGASLDKLGRAWIEVAGGLPDAGPGGVANKSTKPPANSGASTGAVVTPPTS